MLNVSKNNKFLRDKSVKYKSELLDQFLLFQEKNNDHQIRGIIYFNDILDIDVIQESVLQTMKLIPVLGCRFVEEKYRAYWETITSHDKVFRIIKTANIETELNKSLSIKIDIHKGPQLAVRLIRHKSRDILAVIINHMVFDATGLKEYLYLLGRIYTDMIRNNNIYYNKPNTERSIRQIFNQFNITEKLKLLSLFKKQPQDNTEYHFPRDITGKFQPFFIYYKLKPARFKKIQEYSRSHKYTLNDIFLAAYYRSLYKIIQNKNIYLRIPCMVDLRRYLPAEVSTPVCNLSSMIETECEYMENFSDTVEKINRQMKQKKENYPGLPGLWLLLFIYKLLPYEKFKAFTKKNVKYPEISISNIGIISDELSFNNIAIKDAVILAALKFTPCIQLTFSTYRNVVTFSSGLFGTLKDKKIISEFYKIFEQELPDS